MRRTVISLILMLVFSVETSLGKTMREVWIDMPDSITMYLTKSMRTELADYVDMKVSAATKNAIGDTVRIDTLTSDYIAITLSESSKLEMKLLPKDGSNIICMVRTYYGTAAESIISFWQLDWQQLPDISMPALENIELIKKPDSLSVTEFNKIKAMISPKMIEMRLSPDDNSLLLSYSLPDVNKEDSELIKSILVQKKINWNGEIFN
ncbi:MAG: DUF3256 family protein [Prevotella sp.]